MKMLKAQTGKSRVLTYVISIAIPLAVGGLSAWINRGNFETPNLVPPPLAPPAWLFPIVWGILFVLMGVSAGRVYLRGGPEAGDALFVYAASLVVNLLWTVFYFRFQALLLSFFWLLFLLGLVLLMIVRFERACPGAGKLQIPYALWLAFAGYLNLATYLLNTN